MATQCSEKGNQHAVEDLREGDLALEIEATLNKAIS